MSDVGSGDVKSGRTDRSRVTSGRSGVGGSVAGSEKSSGG